MIKNIVTVCDGAGMTGGTEKVAITSAIELAKRDYNSFYFAGEGTLDPEMITAGVIGENLGLKDAYHTSSKKELLSRFFWNAPAGEKFVDFLKKQKLDPKDTIIHFHAFRRVLSAAVVEEAHKLGFKLIFTLHDYGIACPNTSFFNFPEQKICTLKPFSIGCHRSQCTHSGMPMKLMQMGRGWKIRTAGTIKHFHHFIYVSEFSQSVLDRYIPKDTPQTILYNPVSDKQESAAEPADYDVFTFVGRLSPEKGGALFAAAALEAGVKCQFVGKGPEEDNIRAANPDAIFTGWITNEEVVERIRTSRAVVMPSLWYETAGLSVIEAVSRGIPVIVADECASTEYMVNNRSGLTFYSGKQKSLVKALSTMTEEKAKVFGINAYHDYWKSPLTNDKYMNGLLEIYEKTLSS